MNIIIRSASQPTLIDLGAARFFKERLPEEEIVVSIPYSPYELLNGESIDGRVDVYALGMTLLHMLVGLPLSISPEQERILMEESMPLPIGIKQMPSEVEKIYYIEDSLHQVRPMALRLIVSRALAAKPADRYPNMQTFGNELRAYADTMASTKGSR